MALTDGIAGCLTDLLDHEAERRTDVERVDTAIFYSISNCQDGLRGVSLGNFLIKRVVEELTAELPHLQTFATPSPVPGFRQWILDGLEADADIPTELDAQTESQLRRGDRALDPVAHFHLSNGARVEQLNWRANLGQTGWERWLGIMVNYRYTLDRIESNHDRYVDESIVERAPEVEKLLTL